MSDELHDLRDLGGRIRRLFASTLSGVALAGITLLLLARFVHGNTRSAEWFGLFSLALAFLAGYALASVVLRSLAARRWREQRIPRARRVR